METSWPPASTSTMSTSRKEHATCLTSHNHDFLHLPSLMVHLQHSQSGHVNSVPCLPQHQPVRVHQLVRLRTRRGGTSHNRHHGRQQQGHVKINRDHPTSNSCPSTSNRTRSTSRGTSRTCSHRRRHPEHQQRPQCTTRPSGCYNRSSTSSRRTLRIPHHACYKAW